MMGKIRVVRYSEIVGVGSVTSPKTSRLNLLLRRLFQRLKERDEMLRHKFSKEEYDKGKKAELREKIQKIIPTRPDYQQRQRERREEKFIKSILERVMKYLEQFLEQVRVGLFGRFPDGGLGGGQVGDRVGGGVT